VKIISSCGGSGSTFVKKALLGMGWRLCIRPDKGFGKEWKIMKVKLAQVGISASNLKRKDVRGRAIGLVNMLKSLPKQNRVALITIRWGNMGLYRDMPVIYMIRNPLHAYVSFSGGGWLKQNIEHIRFTGTIDPNSKEWIDAWLGDRWLWLKGAEVALEAHAKGNGTVVRYNKFNDDWAKTGMPPISGFSSRDDMAKVKRFLRQETIEYIRSKTDRIWKEVDSL
jgi:hypothetical protein